VWIHSQNHAEPENESDWIFWLLVLSAHHVIVIVKIPVTDEIPRIRVHGRLDEVVVDLNHSGRIPQFSKLQDF
jgi:hypothetical protein